jgi:hypothetical protein
MAKSKHLDHEIILDKPYLYETAVWCKQHFGQRWDPISNRQGRWTVVWAGSSGQYRWCFADEQDAAWFALRWM